MVSCKEIQLASQGNSYFRSQAPPISGGSCSGVTDNPKEGGTSLAPEAEKLYTEAYAKLCEVFLVMQRKFLKYLINILMKHVEKLALFVLGDKDDALRLEHW